MCIVLAAATELGEIKMSAGWCFMSWIIDLCSRRIAAASVYLWPSWNPGKAEPQYSNFC